MERSWDKYQKLRARAFDTGDRAPDLDAHRRESLQALKFGLIELLKVAFSTDRN